MSLPVGYYRKRHIDRARQIMATDRRFRPARRLCLPPDCDDLDRFLVAAYQMIPVKQIAPMLEISLATVNAYLALLRDRGIITTAMRYANPPVSDADRATVAALIAQGYSRRVIAAILGVSRVRVNRIADRLGVPALAQYPRPTPYDTAYVTQMFCVSRLTVIRWVANGWLPDLRPEGVRRKAIAYWWHYDDLVALVRDRRTWMAWTPSTITDPTLRHIAEEARREAGGQWMYRSEIAQYLGVSTVNFKQWTAKGLFAWCEEGYNHALWMTRDDLAAMDLMLVEADRRGLRGRKRMEYLHRALRERFGEEPRSGANDQPANPTKSSRNR